MRPVSATAVLLGIAVACFGWLYGAAAVGLFQQWTSGGDDSYGLLIAAVAIGIAWRRRSAFVAAAFNDSVLPGLCTLVAGIALYLAGTLAAEIFLVRISAIAVAAGTVRVVAGRRSLRVVAPVLIFLLLAIPLPALVVQRITLPLQLVASRMAAAMLAGLWIPVVREGNLLTLNSGALEVSQACSGLRSALSLGALGVVMAWHSARPPGARVALVTITPPIAILTNALRIAVTGFAADTWGFRYASGTWHTLIGWLTFSLAVGVLLGAHRLTDLWAERNPDVARQALVA
jgi:exosortase